MTLPTSRNLLHAAVLAAFLAGGGPAWCQALPQDIARALERAATRGGQAGTDRNEALIAAVIAGLAERPALAAAIVERAIALAPGNRQAIVGAAADAFPGLVQRTGAVSPEPAAPDVDEASVWSGSAEVGGSRNSGNTETTDITVAGLVAYERAPWRHALSADFDFASDRGQETENRLEVEGKTRYDITDRLFLAGRINFEDDDFSGFDYRLTENAALGYRVLDTEDVTFTLQAGPGARQSKIAETGETENEFVGVAESEFVWRISDQAEFGNLTTVTVGTDTTTTDSTTSLSMPITSSVSGKVSFEVRHDTNPPPDTEQTDTTTSFSVVYNF